MNRHESSDWQGIGEMNLLGVRKLADAHPGNHLFLTDRRYFSCSGQKSIIDFFRSNQRTLCHKGFVTKGLLLTPSGTRSAQRSQAGAEAFDFVHRERGCFPEADRLQQVSPPRLIGRDPWV